MLGMPVVLTFPLMDNFYVLAMLMEEFGSGTGEQLKITEFLLPMIKFV